MEKEIISKEEKLLVKGEQTKIKTNIEHLKTYNEKIIKENIYLKTNTNIPIELYIKTSKGSNLAYVQIEENGPETYQINKDEQLGTLKRL